MHHVSLRSGGSGLQKPLDSNIYRTVSMDDPRYRLFYKHYSTEHLRKISVIPANIFLHCPKLYAL